MEDNYSDDVKTTTLRLSTATSKWSPGFETMFNHWSDLQKYEVQWQDHRITMIAVERPKLVTTVQKTWEKECGQMQIKHMK